MYRIKWKFHLIALLGMGGSALLLNSPVLSAEEIAKDQTPVAAECRIKSVTLHGNLRISNSELEQHIAQSKITICQPEDLEDLRISLTQFYISKGYVNSGALLVTQTGSEKAQGIQKIRIIEGRISAIQVKGLGDLQASYLQQRLPRIGQVLYLPELQTAYQNLVSDPLFNKVQSRVLPGEQAGTAILDLELERARSWGGQVTLDNYRAPAIGEVGLGLALWKRNLTGYGDLLELNTTHSKGADPVSVSWTIPLLAYTSSLRLRADRGNTKVISDTLAELDIRSQSSGWEFAYLHKLASSSAWQHELSLALAQRDNQNSLAGLPFSFSAGEVDGYAQIRRLQLSHDLRWFKAEQAWALHNSLILGQNLQNLAQGNVSAVKPHYQIWQGQLQYLRQVSESKQFSGGLQWQWSPDALLNLERYTLGGIHTLPGYRENAVLGNKGVLLYGRWQQAVAQTDWSWFVAGQAGVSVAENEASRHLASLALGWKWQHGSWLAELTLAKALYPAPALANQRALQDRGLHFSLAYRLF